MLQNRVIFVLLSYLNGFTIINVTNLHETNYLYIISLMYKCYLSCIK